MTTKATITYYFDALCGWCFGFSDVMDQVYKKYQSAVEFKVVSGGLFIGDRVGYINDIAPYIKAGAYKTVEEKTGVKFGDQFIDGALQNNSIYLNSLVPAIALCIVKENYPDKTMEFAQLLLKAFYKKGVSSTDFSAMIDCAGELEIDTFEFGLKLKETQYEKKAWEDFKSSASVNLNGYPSMVLTTPEQCIKLSNGYTQFEVLDAKLDRLLNGEKSYIQ